jgi:hypothetical protein
VRTRGARSIKSEFCVEIKQGACHCGAVIFQVELASGMENLRRCNCSLCKRKGAVMADVPLDKLTILQGADKLTLYQWNTRTAKHYFCSVCGIYTHHQRRSNPTKFGFNVACIEGVDVNQLGDISLADGAAQSLV